MESDYKDNNLAIHDTLFDVVVDLAPLIGVVLATSLCLLFLGWVVLGGKTVGVSCWFCHKISKVDKWSVSGWTCKQCGQYNGFTEDGDYNQSLPQQADPAYNQGSHAVRRAMKPQRTVLCSYCLNTQALKMQQKAAWEPTSEETWEQEAEILNRRLEATYRLCAQCEAAVHDELAHQRREVVSANMKPVRAHDVVVPLKGFSLYDWLFPLRSIPVVGIATAIFLPPHQLLHAVFIFGWLSVYIFVYISSFHARPSSFFPFVLMVFALIVNIASEDHQSSLYIQYFDSDTTRLITNIMRHPLMQAALYLLVALKSSLIKSPNIQPKQLNNAKPSTTTFANLSPSPQASPNTSFTGLGGLNLTPNNVQSPSNLQNRFSRSTAVPLHQQQHQQQQANEPGGFGDLNSLLSRIELTPQPKKPSSNNKRNWFIGCIVVVFCALLYYSYFVTNNNESDF